MNVWVWIALLVRFNLAVNFGLLAAGLLLMGLHVSLDMPVRALCLGLVAVLGLVGTRIALGGVRTLCHGL